MPATARTIEPRSNGVITQALIRKNRAVIPPELRARKTLPPTSTARCVCWFTKLWITETGTTMTATIAMSVFQSAGYRRIAASSVWPIPIGASRNGRAGSGPGSRGSEGATDGENGGGGSGGGGGGSADTGATDHSLRAQPRPFDPRWPVSRPSQG